MASNNTEEKLPIIDFSNPEIKPGTPTWEATRAQVFKAFQEYGCFEAVYDKVAAEEAMLKTSKQAFESPLVDKLGDYLKKPYKRFDGQQPKLPFYESKKRSADVPFPDMVEDFASTFWPDGNPEYCNVMKSYTESLEKLDEIVKRMVLESLGLQHYIDEFLDHKNYLLRMNYFKAAAEGENKDEPELGYHTDGSFLTIVRQDQLGLQILKKNEEWIEFDTSTNSFIVLLGDSFMAWTNNRLQAVTHRVNTTGDTNRFSIQLFSSPNLGYTIGTPKELVDEEHPQVFKPYDILDYYKYIMEGAKDGVGLKAYCNVG